MRGGSRAQPRDVLDPRRLWSVRTVHDSGQPARRRVEADADGRHVPRRREDSREPERRAAEEPDAQGHHAAHLHAPAVAGEFTPAARPPGRAQAEIVFAQISGICVGTCLTLLCLSQRSTSPWAYKVLSQVNAHLPFSMANNSHENGYKAVRGPLTWTPFKFPSFARSAYEALRRSRT